MGSGSSSSHKYAKVHIEAASSNVKAEVVTKVVSTSPNSIIRFLELNALRLHGQFPRYPQQKHLVTSIEDINRDESLIVFISHKWLQSSFEDPHPDNDENSIYELCVEGIEKLKSSFTVNVKKVYVWFDFSCINQDSTNKAEILELPRIMSFCDCVYTPIFDPQHEAWTLPHGVMVNYLREYKAKSWRSGYLNRSWCRLEMFYGANIPMVEAGNKINKRHLLFRQSLGHHITNGRRPHVLFGSRELRSGLLPIMMPPIQNAFYEKYNPLEGDLTMYDRDLPLIQDLVAHLAPLMTVAPEEYTGPTNARKEKHGFGVCKYANGDVYRGQFDSGERHGKGHMAFMTGDVYEGEWAEDFMEGQGVLRFVNGNVYVGQFVGNLRHGSGTHTIVDPPVAVDLSVQSGQTATLSSVTMSCDADGTAVNTTEKYSGEWNNDCKHGRGRYTFANGDTYEGEYLNDMKHGRGTYRAATGDIYDGEFFNNCIHGLGLLKYGNGDVYEGEFCRDLKHGHGIMKFVSGDVYDGEYQSDVIQGMGKMRYANGELYDGDFREEYRHGYGEMTFVNGDKYQGNFFKNQLSGGGHMIYAKTGKKVVFENGKRKKYVSLACLCIGVAVVTMVSEKMI